MEFRKEDILNYGFYNEQKEYIAVLNVDKIKEILNADIILLNEKEHK